MLDLTKCNVTQHKKHVRISEHIFMTEREKSLKKKEQKKAKIQQIQFCEESLGPFPDFFVHICHTSMFQINKPILILDNNPSKYKMQFLSDDSM